MIFYAIFQLPGHKKAYAAVTAAGGRVRDTYNFNILL